MDEILIMFVNKSGIYRLGERPNDSELKNGVTYIKSINELPNCFGSMLYLDHEDSGQIDDWLKAFYHRPYSWSWCVYVTKDTPLSRCVTDGIFDEEASSQTWREMQGRIESIYEPESLDPLIGWLGVNRKRRIEAIKSLESTSIYSYPIIELLFPDISSTYSYVQSEKNRGILEAEQLVDRIRVCSSCNSGHLNYVEVCPDCSSIDIDSQSSLHCFTCGYVGEQHCFYRRDKLECPKCLTQLRHIGVDYDRPLENYACNHCSSLFVEANTVSHCLSCNEQVKVEELVVRKIFQFKLGGAGEYVYLHGKAIQAPELSIEGKVDVSFFQHLLTWVNKVALRHQESHLLLGLHLPSLDSYGKEFGDTKLFSLMEQLTTCLSDMFRDTDICCQYRQDILLVFMPQTPATSLSVLQEKLTELGNLIEDDDFELSVFAWSLPDVAINDGMESWLEAIAGEVYAAR